MQSRACASCRSILMWVTARLCLRRPSATSSPPDSPWSTARPGHISWCGIYDPIHVCMVATLHGTPSPHLPTAMPPGSSGLLPPWPARCTSPSTMLCTTFIMDMDMTRCLACLSRSSNFCQLITVMQGNPQSSWAAYIAGCLLVLAREGPVPQGAASVAAALAGCSVSICVCSEVPEGKGVSSSASVEVATMSALTAALVSQCTVHIKGGAHSAMQAWPWPWPWAAVWPWAAA